MPFYAHGRPKEQCQQKLTDTQRKNVRCDITISLNLFHFFKVSISAIDKLVASAMT